MDLHERRHFLSLPSEIRVLIYKYALVSKSQIAPRRAREKGESTVAAPLLRTCKQIHHEAAPILYSGNQFLIDFPRPTLFWFKEIGDVNVRYLERLRIFVAAEYGHRSDVPAYWSQSRSLWHTLLERVASEATGLRFLEVYFDAEPSCGLFGAGKDFSFLHKLARIRGLEEMVMEGYFLKEWPEYVEREIGKPVWYAYGLSETRLRELRKYD